MHVMARKMRYASSRSFIQLNDWATLRVTRSSKREIELARDFDATVERVFDALTEPEALKQWFGPRGWTVTDVRLELRIGGTCDLTMRSPSGSETRMHAVYREILAPVQIVRVEHFDDWPPVTSVILLTESVHGSHFSATIVYPSGDVADADVAAGLVRDASEAYDKLAEYLARQG